MKNITKLSMLALAVFTAACAQVEDPTEPQNPSGDNVVVFEANVPTKTAISNDDKTVTWVAGDEVKFIWEGGETTATASASGASTTFAVGLPEEVTEVYAVYPAATPASIADGNIVMNFSSELSGGDFKDSDICVAKTLKSEDTWNTTLNFKNAACLLKVGVSGNEITQVQIASVNNEIIAGELTVAFDNDGNLSFTYPESGSTTVNMAVTGPGNYYVPVFPDVQLTEGFRINCFVPGDEGETQLTPFYYNGTFTTGRGQVIILSEIESRLGQYYVTPNGAGSKAGQSWANAMDAATFKAFVENGENHDLINGAVFHFSAESFDFGDYLYTDFTNRSEVTFTLEGTKTADAMTVFVGRSGQPAGILWPHVNTNLTVKNVRLTGTDGDSNRAAVRMTTSSAKLTLEGCEIVNNRTADKGGAIAIYNASHLTVKNCTISGNSGNGGVIYAKNDSGDGPVIRIEETVIENHESLHNPINLVKVTSFDIVDSEIKDNTTYAFIYAQGVGTFTAERTKWTNNHAYDDSGSGAFIEGAGTYTFTDCEFVGNHADWRGGALCVSGNSTTATVSVVGGKFEGNYTTGVGNEYAGGVLNLSAPVTVDFTGVDFIENYSFVGSNTNAGGIIQITKAGGVVRCNDCLFDGNYTNRSIQDNAAAAAIINCRTGGVKYYFNACEFKNNTSGKSTSGNEQGGTKGTVIASYRASTIALNNCSMHDNFGARDNTENLSWIYVDNSDNILVISNSTIVGDPTIYGGNRLNDYGVIKLHTKGNYYLINNILCSNVEGGQTVWCGVADTKVFSYYNKTNPELDGRIDWGTDTGSGHDYWGSSSCFAGWSLPYTWNGTLTGTNSSMKATTADVNTQIQNSDSDFYNWLSDIGALGKDINGNNRGTTSWPGCYQAN